MDLRFIGIAFQQYFPNTHTERNMHEILTLQLEAILGNLLRGLPVLAKMLSCSKCSAQVE